MYYFYLSITRKLHVFKIKTILKKLLSTRSIHLSYNCIPTGPSSTGQMHLRELHVRCKRHESTRIIMLKKWSKMFKKGPMNSSQSINEFPWENNFFSTVKGNMSNKKEIISVIMISVTVIFSLTCADSDRGGRSITPPPCKNQVSLNYKIKLTPTPGKLK